MGFLLKIFACWLVAQSPERLERLARRLGFLIFRVLGVRRRLIEANLATALPHLSAEDRQKIGQESVSQFIMTAFEFLRAPSIDPVPDVEIVGAEHLKNALGQGQGAYVLCFHLGNWEVMGATMNRLIAPSYVLVKKVGFSGLDRYVSEVRETIGFLTVKRQKKGDGFRRIQEILGQGEVVGFVMDQSRPGEPKLPFFGKPAKTNTSLAAIHQKIPAPIVAGYMIRKSLGKHQLVFEPPLELSPPGDPASDVLQNSILFNAVVERAVRAAPQCYFWMHNRWK